MRERIARTLNALLVRRYLSACTQIGDRITLQRRPRIANRGTLTIGDDGWICSHQHPVELEVHPGAEIRIGDRVVINYGTYISAHRSVRLGHRVMIGNGCVISDAELPDHPGAVHDARPVSIGNDVWIASRVVVLPGTVIHDGAAVAAGSVVGGDIPPRTLVAGSPARAVRSLAPPAGDRAAREIGCAIVSSFAPGELVSVLEAIGGEPRLDCRELPLEALDRPGNGRSADCLLVWVVAAAALPSLAAIGHAGRLEDGALDREVDAFCDRVAATASQFSLTVVPTWTCPPGLVNRALMYANLRLARRLGDHPDLLVLDAQCWTGPAGEPTLSEAARDIHAAFGAAARTVR